MNLLNMKEVETTQSKFENVPSGSKVSSQPFRSLNSRSNIE
jgi:hypothetical protein